MQLLPDGTFRFSPRDLVAYLEGDFAAWCERMHVERDRPVASGHHEPAWATPDETDEEAALAARRISEALCSRDARLTPVHAASTAAQRENATAVRQDG
jgi:hypothetical protein